MYQLQYVDLLLPFVYLFLFLGAVWLYSNGMDTANRFRFRLGFVAKIMGCFIFMGMYLFYFKNGDTFLYFEGAGRIYEVFVENPVDGVRLLLLPSGKGILAYSDVTVNRLYSNSTPEWTLTKVAAIINLFCFNNYLCLSLCFASFSFLGTWAIYRVFATIYPLRSRAFFYLIFFIPSCLVWTSGLLKDSICLGSIGLVLYALHQSMLRKKLLLHIPAILVLFFLVMQIKPYLAYSFLCCMFFWVYLRQLQRTKHALFKDLLRVSFFLLLFVMLVNSLSIIKEAEKQMVFKESISRVKGYHVDSQRSNHEGTSRYSLGVVEYSAVGIIKKTPLAIVTALFRPFLWESRKPLMLLMSLENILCMFFLLLLLTRKQLWRNPFVIFSNPEVIFCFSFVLLLGLIVGITTYNFGLLMRLKTPLLPFFSAGVVVIYDMISSGQKAWSEKALPSVNARDESIGQIVK